MPYMEKPTPTPLAHELIPAVDSSSRRMMVVLHGLGDSLDGYRWLPDILNLDWLNYVLVNAPDPYFGGYSWYDYAGNPAPGVSRSRAQVFSLLDELRGRGYPTEETILFGFSQGCLMTIDVGLRYPHRFGGLVGVSGYVFEPQKLLHELSPVARAQRFLITHGRFDPTIPLAPVRAQIELLRAAGLNLGWHEFEKAHTIAGAEEINLIRSFVRECIGPRTPKL